MNFQIKIKIDTSDIDFVGINIVFKQIKMALEDWKDFIGNSATFFTILQFLMGIQVSLVANQFKNYVSLKKSKIGSCM